MPSLVLAKSFLERFASLSKPVQNDVTRLLEKFSDMSRSQSVHLEPIKGALDPNVRTVRVNQGVRGIVAAPKGGDTFILIDVLPHDDATQWCLRKRLNVNHVTGALEICDISVGAVEEPKEEKVGHQRSLFHKRKDADFVDVGIDPLFLPTIRALKDEIQVATLAANLPPAQGQALEMLAAGYSVDAALCELLAGASPNGGGHDRDNLADAAKSAVSGSSFYVVESASGLAAALNAPLDHWRIFLHPMQRSLAYKEEFRGPVQVLGGPGTGKTVVALHRAAFLAERLANTTDRLLLTTFTRSLAGALSQQMQMLGKSRSSQMDVENIDALAHRIVKTVEGTKPRIASNAALESYCAAAIAKYELKCSPEFLRREWESVVLSNGAKARDEYFAAPRAGRGVRLSRSLRARYWNAIEDVLQSLRESGERTHLQIAESALEYVFSGKYPQYAHVLVDEAQDLHPVQWRLLRALAAEGPNDMFIVGDPHQRIYDNRVALSTVGISIRGRSSKLRVNYRTTYEILQWALGMLEGVSVDDLDGSVDDLRGYRSLSHGPVPILIGANSRADELAALVMNLKEWEASGMPHSTIGIAARTAALAKTITSTLRKSGLPIRQLADGEPEAAAITVGTMHSMKGLEFRAVAVVGADDDLLPHIAAIASRDEDPLQNGFDVLRERCLFFVACTRARDFLRVSWQGTPSRFLDRTSH